MAHGGVLVELCPVQESFPAPATLESSAKKDVNNQLLISHLLCMFAEVSVHLRKPLRCVETGLALRADSGAGERHSHHSVHVKLGKK